MRAKEIPFPMLLSNSEHNYILIRAGQNQNAHTAYTHACINGCMILKFAIFTHSSVILVDIFSREFLHTTNITTTATEMINTIATTARATATTATSLNTWPSLLSLKTNNYAIIIAVIFAMFM